MRQNYKAKWQSALRQQTENPSIEAKELTNHITDSKRVGTDLNLALSQIGSVNGEVVKATKELVECMDETRMIAGLSFGEVQMEIDQKVSSLPIHVCLRRVRDVIQLAEARFALLAIRAEELHDANEEYKVKVKTLEAQSLLSTRTLTDLAWIGPKSTEQEREDYKDSRGEYHRFDLTYQDMDDEWLTQHLTADTVLKRRVRTPALTDGDDTDSEIEDAKSRALIVQNNRMAAITPKSPIATRQIKNQDLRG